MQTSSANSNIMVLGVDTREYIQNDSFRHVFNHLEILSAELIIEKPQGVNSKIEAVAMVHEEAGDLLQAMKAKNDSAYLRELYDLTAKCIKLCYDTQIQPWAVVN